MNRETFQAWCREKTRLLDGATGTNMRKAGLPVGVCAEKWMLEHPQPITQLQKAYAEAGSDIVYAPTFGLNRFNLASFGLESELQTMNRQLVQLSLRAVDGRAMVAGDLTTTGQPVGKLPMTYAHLMDIYREQALALIDGGVELFAVETMMGVTECMAALEAIRSVSDLPVMVSLSFQSDGMCYFDGNCEKAGEYLEALGADVLGVNCSNGPEMLENVVRLLKRSCSLPILAKPNAGLPIMQDDGSAVYPMGPEEFAEHTLKLRDAGADLLGGCCGTAPDYIRALKERL